jgi:hypothetical protein
MKKFIYNTQQWLNHRLRQLIWKRWKKPKTRYRMLRRFGNNHDEAMKLANSQKGYWRLSCIQFIHLAITKERLIKWGLRDMTTLYEHRYLKG